MSLKGETYADVLGPLPKLKAAAGAAREARMRA